VTSARWIVATSAGFALTGVALHSPGASGVGGSFLDWDVVAAIVGSVFGAVAGAFTGLLQMIAMRARVGRVLLAMVVTVSVAHALADGAPSSWGVPTVAALSAIIAGAAFAWSTGVRGAIAIGTAVVSWWGGWVAGVLIAGALNLSGGSTADVWASEHAVIGATVGLVFGAATSPAMRRILGAKRALSSAG
jgi:hypothetical protein